jgi:hypothetical protein
MPFCPHCGKTIEIVSVFCPHCGNKITPSAIDPLNDPIVEEEFGTFIGKRADHYLRKFSNFSGKGTSRFAVTWNWSAFFLGFIWMLYRKMYLWALGAFFIAFTPVALPLTMIGWGIVGNYLYYLHARNKILDYKSRQNATPHTLSLSDLGGVNHWVWFVGFIFFLFLLIIGILGFLLFLHFLEYTGFVKPEFVEI